MTPNERRVKRKPGKTAGAGLLLIKTPPPIPTQIPPPIILPKPPLLPPLPPPFPPLAGVLGTLLPEALAVCGGEMLTLESDLIGSEFLGIHPFIVVGWSMVSHCKEVGIKTDVLPSG